MSEAPIPVVAGPAAIPRPRLLRLRFPGPQEREYLRDHTRAFVPVLRLSVSLIVLLYFSYLGLDHLLFGRYVGLGIYGLILGLAAPVALIGIAVTFMPVSDLFIRLGVMFATIVNGAALLFAHYTGLRQGAPIPYESIIILMYYTYFLLGIEQRYATVMAGATVLAHFVLARAGGLPADQLFDHLYMMTVVFFVGAAASYVIDLLNRRNWWNERRLAELAEIDTLTGLPNARTFFSRADSVLQAERVADTPVALLLLTPEHLPGYGPNLGHPAADASMRMLGQALLAAEPGATAIGYLGGEYFAVLLTDCRPERARAVAAELCRGIAQLRIAHPGAPAGRVTLSAGSISISPLSVASARAAVQLAYEALFRSQPGTAGRQR